MTSTVLWVSSPGESMVYAMADPRPVFRMAGPLGNKWLVSVSSPRKGSFLFGLFMHLFLFDFTALSQMSLEMCVLQFTKFFSSWRNGNVSLLQSTTYYLEVKVLFGHFKMIFLCPYDSRICISSPKLFPEPCIHTFNCPETHRPKMSYSLRVPSKMELITYCLPYRLSPLVLPASADGITILPVIQTVSINSFHTTQC